MLDVEHRVLDIPMDLNCVLLGFQHFHVSGFFSGFLFGFSSFGLLLSLILLSLYPLAVLFLFLLLLLISKRRWRSELISQIRPCSGTRNMGKIGWRTDADGGDCAAVKIPHVVRNLLYLACPILITLEDLVL